MTTHARTIARAVVLALLADSAIAHEGHDDAPGTEQATAGVSLLVQVSSEARKNLGLELAEAALRPMESALVVIGEIAPLPNRAGAVTSRIAGRVTWVGVAEGDLVRKGEPVVEVESLQLGDPPPRARYGAPVSGRVIDRHVVAGDSVEPNVHLLEVADLSEVLAVGHLFEGQIGRVKVGQKARVRVPSYPDAVFEGTVDRIGSALDPTTRSLLVYVRIGNTDGQLLPRMPAELTVVVASSDAALAIPQSALLGDFGNQFVFVEKDPKEGIFERVPVVRGLADDRFVEIVEGVLPGDSVVTVGNYSLQFLPAFEASQHTSDEKPHLAASPPAGAPSPWRERIWPLALGGLALAGGAAVVLRRRRAASERI